jgi:hypothetical protein
VANEEKHSSLLLKVVKNAKNKDLCIGPINLSSVENLSKESGKFSKLHPKLIFSELGGPFSTFNPRFRVENITISIVELG